MIREIFLITGKKVIDGIDKIVIVKILLFFYQFFSKFIKVITKIYIERLAKSIDDSLSNLN